MKLSTFATAAMYGAAVAANPPFERLDKDNAALLIIDHQIGLTSIVRDYTPLEIRAAILGHAAIGNLFDLPVVITSSADSGPNGPIFKEILDMHPNAPFIKRQGEVDAWDNADFRAAVKATNKTQLIVAGITTDVCTSFLSLSLRGEGYAVWANTEASGTFDNKLAVDANRRMENAGVTLVGNFAIVMDLMRDWRNTPGITTVLPFLDTYLPQYSFVARAHASAILNGTLVSGVELPL